jgi:hypothetical protein
MADEIVIVGDDGTEHVFPKGFNPLQAAQIVKQQRLKTANATPLKEPSNYVDGFLQSAKDTASRTGISVLKGAASMLDPRTYAEGHGNYGQADLDRLRAMPTPGVGQAAKDVGSAAGEMLSSPEEGGQLLGGIVGGLVLPHAVNAATKLPVGRLVTSAYEGTKAAAQHMPIVGPPMRAGAQAAIEAWRASAPNSATMTAPEAGVATQAPTMPAVAGEAPASGLSASERAALARQNYDAPTMAKIEAELRRKGIMQGLESGAPKPTAPTDASGRSLGGYAGPERRIASPGATPEGLAERRLTPSTDQPMGLKPGFERADVADAARKMRAENPAIDEQAAAMRQKATEAGRPGKPPRQGGEGNGGGSNGEEWVPVRQSKSHRNPMVPELQGKGTGNDVLDVVGPEKEAYEKQYGVKVTSVKKVPKSMFDQIEAQRKMREAAYRGDAEILKRLKIIEALDK